MMKISMFVRDPFKGRSRDGKYRLRFNPYIEIVGREICIDSDGIAFHGKNRSFGFIRGSGFWRSA